MFRKSYWIVSFLLLIPAISFSQGNPNFNGQWTLLSEKSSEIGLYNTLSIDFKQEAESVTIIQKWGTSRSFSDTLQLNTDGKFSDFPINDRVFPSNVFMGLSMNVGKTREIKANWDQIEEITKIKVMDAGICGGLSKSQTFVQIVADTLRFPVKIYQTIEATGLGAAICAAVGAGIHSSFPEAIKAMVHLKDVVVPGSQQKKLKKFYKKWWKLQKKVSKLI